MYNKRPPTREVREPVQVYLGSPDRAMLERAALVSGVSRAEVLRLGLRRFAAELLADESPALAFLDRTSAADPPMAPTDVALRHDEYLADWATASWGHAPSAPSAPARKPAAKRKRK